MQYFGEPTSYLLSVLIVNFVSISEQKESSRDAQCDTRCMTSEVECFDWLRKQPVNHSSEPTIIN